MTAIRALLTTAVLALGGLALAQTVPATHPAPAPTPGPKNDAGLTATLTSAKETYAIAPGQSGKEFRDSLVAAARGGRMPASPVVDLTLTVKNESAGNVTMLIGGDQSSMEFHLQGPGAVTHKPNIAMTMDFRMGKPTALAPGQTTEFKLANLTGGARGISEYSYWTEPGEYTLTVTLHYTQGEERRHVTSGPLKLKIEAAGAK